MRKLKLVIELYFVRILDIREKENMNQTQMAALLNTSQANYSRWESGAEFIPLKRLNLLCNKFNASMDYVLGLSKVNQPTKKVELDKKIIGNNLKIFRKSKGLTQLQLAEILNTTQSTISAYEAGKTLILTAFAYQLAEQYNLSLDWLTNRKIDK